MNETKEISYQKIKIIDIYNVPKIVALHPIRAKLLGLKLGDTLSFKMPNGSLEKRIYGDNMDIRGKYYWINWGRVDFLNNKDIPCVQKHDIELIL